MSRRRDQKILFPTLGVEVLIVSVRSGQVRIGVNAPSDVPVIRDDVSKAKPQSSLPPRPKATLTAEQRERLTAAGMGLALVQKQLEHDLTDEAERSVEEALRAFEELEAELTGRPPAAKTAPTRAGLAALLVEDDRNESSLLSHYLELNGFDVATAGDGLAALDHMSRKGAPDLMLLDMNMPRCDGPTTVAQIRKDARFDAVKIFGVSGHDPEDYEMSGRLDGWFAKPLNPSRVVDSVRAAFAHLN